MKECNTHNHAALECAEISAEISAEKGCSMTPEASKAKAKRHRDNWKAKALKLKAENKRLLGGVDNLLDCCDKYVQLMEDEIGDIAGLAIVHGCASERVEAGIKCRRDIRRAKQALKGGE